jgi:hypothetical protein
VVSLHICRAAPSAREKVIVPPPSDLALGTIRTPRHVTRSSANSSMAVEIDYRGNFLVRFFSEGAGNDA